MTDPAGAEAVVARRQPQAAAGGLAGRPRSRAGGALTCRRGAAYDYPEQAVDAFMHLVSYARNLETAQRDAAAPSRSRFALDRGRVKELMAASSPEGMRGLSEAASKSLLDAYEIPVTKPPGASADEAVGGRRADRLPRGAQGRWRRRTSRTRPTSAAWPTGIDTAGGARGVRAHRGPRSPSANPTRGLRGVTVQPMAPTPGYELLLGARRDPTLRRRDHGRGRRRGAELLGDRALELPPLNERLARRMLESLRIWPLLRGHRGRPAVDLDALLEVLMRFSYLVADYPEIDEVEINPLLATAEGAVALDAARWSTRCSWAARRRPSRTSRSGPTRRSTRPR